MNRELCSPEQQFLGQESRCVENSVSLKLRCLSQLGLRIISPVSFVFEKVVFLE